MRATTETNRKPPRHLSLVAGIPTQLLAYHTSRDIAAWRLATNEERLYINGKHIPLKPAEHTPTQVVINLCNISEKNLDARLDYLLTLEPTQ